MNKKLMRRKFLTISNLALALISLQTFLLPLGIFGLTAGLFWNLYRTRRELLRSGTTDLTL